jgi:superfamily II DNA/RNA helicase
MARIVDLLLEAGPQGVTREELLVLARARIRETYSERQLDRDLERLGPRIVRDGARLRLGDTPPAEGQPPEVGPGPAAEVGTPPHLRVAAFDIETTVELDPAQRDSVLRTIYQVAVRRIGPDAAWVSERPRFAAYVHLADEKLHLVHRGEETRVLVAAAASPDAVFTEVADVLAGAHVVVSYNGTHFDFELLKAAVRHAGRELAARLRWADALMVAVSLYELPLGDTLALAPSSLADLRAVRDRLLEWLERGTLGRSVRTAFGHLPLDPGARSFGRKLVIASPLDGRSAASGLGGVRTELGAAANAIYGAARAVQDVPHGRSRIDEERRSTLENRLRTLQENLYEVVNRIREIERDSSANWIVWAEELLAHPEERLYETGQELRFRVVAAPLEVAQHPEFVRLTQGTFPTVAYVSATLKVTGSFAFIRERLGLPAGLVEEEEVPTSFDFARQARLVAFSDFPSWQENVDAACRSIAQQVHRFELEVTRPGENGVMVMTTARATAAAIGAELERLGHNDGASYALHHQLVRGTWQAVLAFSGRRGETAAEAGVLVGTKGLWQGVDVADEHVLRMIWINKLPFASPTEPLIAARTARIARRLADEDERFQDHIAATEEASRRYYLPLAAIELRQAVGRLIRTDRHRGAIVISDRKLDGPDRWRRRNREFFLGSLDPGLLRADAETGEGDGAGNVVTMAEGWRQMWEFFATGPEPLLSLARLAQLTTDDALDAHTQLPEVRNIRALRFGREEWDALVAAGRAENVLVERCTAVARELRRDAGFALKPEQEDAIRAIARREDLLALLPTSFGKSYIYQLPALVLPGVTIVVSPLVALMTDQARALHRSIGNAVRALVAPMRESNSRSGKQEVIDQLRGVERGIRLIYLSPERLATAQFQGPLLEGVRNGHVRLIALDEAHTFVTWGDDFRPAFRRAANFLRELRAAGAHVIGLTATAKDTVRHGLRERIWSPQRPAGLCTVRASPVRPNLALYARDIAEGQQKTALLESLAREFGHLRGHAIVYTLTIKEAVRIARHLRLLVGERHSWRVEVFHGMLPPDEKGRVLDKFKDAPRADDPDGEFQPLIVVATGAFGLGVDREDVLAVLVASPPPDLANLFQQVGRAGRGPGSTAFGLMLASGRSLGLIEWLIHRRQSAKADLVREIAERLTATDAVDGFDARAIADDIVERAIADPTDPANPEHCQRLQREVRTVVVQVVAELDALGVIEDLGDWPDLVRIDPGRLDGQTAETREEAEAIVAAATSPAAQSLADLWRALGQRYAHAGELLQALLELHAVGALDVSQAPMTRYLTGIRRTGVAAPADLVRRLQRPLDDALAEYGRVRSFFADPRCRHVAFAEYLDAGAPEHVCESAATRCDTCWRTYRGEEAPPELHRLFTMARPADASDGQLDALRRRQLADSIAATLRTYRRGLTPSQLRAVLAGEDTIYRTGRPPFVLRHPLPSLPTFGSFQGVTQREFNAAVGALVASGHVRRTRRESADSRYSYEVLEYAAPEAVPR